MQTILSCDVPSDPTADVLSPSLMIVLFIVLARNKLRIPLEGTYSFLGTAVRRLRGALDHPAGWRETESSQCGITVAMPWISRA